MNTQKYVYTIQERMALQVSACAKYGYTDIRFNDNGSVDVKVSAKWKTAYTAESARTFLDSAEGKNLQDHHEEISALFSLFEAVGNMTNSQETPESDFAAV